MVRIAIAAAIGGMVLGVSSAGAAEVMEKVELAAAPDKVWAAIGDFCGIANWHPAVAKCELEAGDKPVRTLTTGDGAVLVEAQEARDDAAMSYSYSIMESPLPVANYVAIIKVSGSGEASTVEWSSIFEPKGASEEEAKKIIAGIYRAGFDGLKKQF